MSDNTQAGAAPARLDAESIAIVTVVRMCSSCHRRPAELRRKRCDRCNEHSRNYSARLIEAGKCIKCRSPHEGSNATCESCLSKDRIRRKSGPVRGGRCPSCRRNKSVAPFRTCPSCRENNRLLRAERIKRGLCVRACGAFALPGKRICLACKEEKMRAFDVMVAAAHANKTCINHKDRPLDPRSTWYCTQCRDAQAATRRDKYRKRRDAGLCPDCGKEARPGHVYCPKHTR